MIGGFNTLNSFAKYLEFSAHKNQWLFIDQVEELNERLKEFKPSQQISHQKREQKQHVLALNEKTVDQKIEQRQNTTQSLTKEQLLDTSIEVLYRSKKNLDSLNLFVRDCQQCTLCLNRKSVVFGQGNQDADIMFIGEGPGAEEDNQGLPFVGKSGQFLTHVINSIGLDRGSVYITNIVKCRPPQNRNPAMPEIIECTKILKQQIELIRPKLIIGVGSIALKSLIDQTHSIVKQSGRIFEYNRIPFVPIYHPAYLLRNPKAIDKLWHDMRIIRSLILKYKLF